MAPQLSEDEVDDLIFFARSGDKDELVTLLSTIADREKVAPAQVLSVAKDEGKSTCLHMATGNGHINVVRFLLEAFASEPHKDLVAFLDSTNEYGNTGLHWAALGGHLDTVQLLMQSGASPALANDNNYVPLDLASLNDHRAVVDHFLAASEGLESEAGLEGAVANVELTGQEPEQQAGSSQSEPAPQ